MPLPKEFIEKYKRLLGNQAAAFLIALGGKPISGFRTNPLKPGQPTTAIDYASGKVPYVNGGYYGNVDGQSLDHVTGWVYSQEPSAMYVGEVVDPQPGERVLDLCAAPGGKSTHLIGKMNDQGLLVANEIFKKRAQVLAQNLERWGTRQTVVANENPAQLAKHFRQFFDRILVDAPCSGEGMFRKDPGAIEYWKPDYPAECANRQRKILTSAILMLKPGGILVYSTCTFAPEEDEQNVAWLLEKYPLTLVEVPHYRGMDQGRPDWADGNPELAKCVRMFPHHFRGEGHFIAKLQLADSVTGTVPKIRSGQRRLRRDRPSLDKEQRSELQSFLSTVVPNYQPHRLVTYGEQLYDVPVQIPTVRGLKILRPGLHLGVFKKHRFEPALALALALQPDKVSRQLTLTAKQWRQYVHGDVITLNGNHARGWYLLTCDGHSCGFGKLVGQQLKNFYPKGLRF